MNKIFKEIKRIEPLFKSYRLIVTEDVIELRFTPHDDKENEVNYSYRNTKYDRMDLLFHLSINHKTD